MTRVLVLVHCFNNLGGVELFTRRLIARLSGFDLTIAYPEQGKLVVASVGGDGGLVSPQAIPFAEFGVVAPFSHGQCEQAIQNLLQVIRPDLIHVVHFLNWPLSIFRHLLAEGRPLVVSHHDFYSITPIFTLEGGTGIEETISKEYSERVFKSDLSAYLKQRRHYLADVFSQIPHHTVPSPFLGEMLKETFGISSTVVEYGIDPFPVPEPTPTWSNFRFGYYGSLLPQKGWGSLVEGFLRIRAEAPHAELHLFGGGAAPKREGEGIYYHGAFTPEQLPHVLQQCDVAFLPSVFPETYSMMLSELWRAKKPVAASRIGALANRVIDYGNGRLFKPGDPASIAEVMRWFLTSDSWRHWIAPEVRGADQMALEFRGLYASVLA